MSLTLFNTPVLRPVLRAKGWRIDGALPAEAQRCVLIAAPHTSNWDLPYTLALGLALRMQLRWVGKASLFKPPFGGLMRWLGGLPVDRSKTNNAVASTAAAIRAADGPLQLVISPEGTRSRVADWKTGFWYIAREAGVPIVLAHVDHGRKHAGLSAVFQTSGHVQDDIARIRSHYAGMTGVNERQFDDA
jgi:1-acyl-sn-glycerol-3-phosphate acyltransferase